MSVYLGDYALNSTIYMLWSTNTADGSSATRQFNGTIRVYRNNNTTFSLAGITDIEDFDSVTGIHSIAIDTTQDTGFYVGNSDYEVTVVDVTVDGVSNINAVLGHFTITKLSTTTIAGGGTGRTAAPILPLILHASGGMGTSTGGGGDVNNLPERAETAGQNVNYQYLAMLINETVFWNVEMPLNWDAGTLTAVFVWTVGADGSDDVNFEIRGRSFANDDPLDAALGAAQSVEDSWIANEDVHITSATSAITLAGTPAAGEYVVIEVKRVAPAGTDLSVGLRLLAVRCAYTAVGYSES